MNKISTVFGRDAFQDYINRQVRNGDLVRIKNRDIQTSERSALIAEGYGKDASGDNVAQETKNVNYSLSDFKLSNNQLMLKHLDIKWFMASTL